MTQQFEEPFIPLDDIEEEEKRPIQERDLTSVIKIQARIEKLRIGFGNRVAAADRGSMHVSPELRSMIERMTGQLASMEDDAQKVINKELATYDVWNSWLCHVRGINVGLGGQILGLLLPPRPEDSVGSWYRAAGLVPVYNEEQGKFRLPSPHKGEGAITYHPYIRRCLFNVAVSFIRSGRFYRQVYLDTKLKMTEKHAGDKEKWPPFRVDRTARWITVKLFLSHLWDEYCKVMGQDVKVPYAIAILGHSGFIPVPQWDGVDKI